MNIDEIRKEFEAEFTPLDEMRWNGEWYITSECSLIRICIIYNTIWMGYLAAHEAQQKKLDDALAMGAMLRQALSQVRIFVTSREKIKHPEGTEWFDDALSATSETAEKFVRQIKAEALREAADAIKDDSDTYWARITLREMADELKEK